MRTLGRTLRDGVAEIAPKRGVAESAQAEPWRPVRAISSGAHIFADCPRGEPKRVRRHSTDGIFAGICKS